MKVRLHVGAAPVLPPGRRRALSALVMGMLAAQSAVAIEIDTGNPDWKLRWDNTVKASLMQRLKDASPTLSAQPPLTVNQDDGDNNFKKGLVSSRIDLLSELDLTGPGYGARLSGALPFRVRVEGELPGGARFGVDQAQALALPDHYDFADWPRPLDRDYLLLCTEKDAVKLDLEQVRKHRPKTQVWVAALDFSPGADFWRALDARLSSLHR